MKAASLRSFIRNDAELSPHESYIEAIMRNSVDISLSPDRPEDQGSRFGGLPLVPADFSWPDHEKGEYRFLGQVNFSEIDDCPDELPAAGMLSLFYAFDEDAEIFWGDDGYVLGYYWPDVGDLTLLGHSENVKPSKKIVLERGIEIPRSEISRNDWPFEPDILYALQDLSGYREDYMLGYPSWHTLAYDPTPADGWISLMTLKSRDELGWCWHDGDKLMVFIEESKLRRADFGHLKTDAG